MDITSLYTVIPNHEGLQTLKYFFHQRANKQPGTETLIRLAELVLTLNCFSFSGNYYKQINGVAMETKIGPSYAILFVGFIEQQFFDKFDGNNPELYHRYIDDCFGATSCREFQSPLLERNWWPIPQFRLLNLPVRNPQGSGRRWLVLRMYPDLGKFHPGKKGRLILALWRVWRSP